MTVKNGVTEPHSRLLVSETFPGLDALGVVLAGGEQSGRKVGLVHFIWWLW